MTTVSTPASVAQISRTASSVWFTSSTLGSIFGADGALFPQAATSTSTASSVERIADLLRWRHLWLIPTCGDPEACAKIRYTKPKAASDAAQGHRSRVPQATRARPRGGDFLPR